MASNSSRSLSAAQRVDMVFGLLERGSSRGYIGEKISQLEHALQAALFATQSKADKETVLAALLHDIGQFCSPSELNQMLVDDLDASCDAADPECKPSDKKTVSVGVMGHEKLGSDYLGKLGFSKKVCDLVESHVVAKRYLTAVDPDYFASLSNASKRSLKFQGGPFAADEVRGFESDPLFKQKVQLRKWDDASKIVGLETPGLETYREMAVSHLSAQIGSGAQTIKLP